MLRSGGIKCTFAITEDVGAMLALPFPPFWAGCFPELHTVLQLSMLVQTPHLEESGITLRTGDLLPVRIIFAPMFVILSIAKLK